MIEHPPGEETQFDWLELPDPPAHWGWGSKAFLLVGALAHSGRWRGVLAESTDQPHLIDALHRICAALGGLTRTLAVRPDGHRLPPRQSGRVTASFAAVAKHYGVSVAICPARRGNRKGVVEKANHIAAQRWWRTLPDDAHRRAGPGVAGPVVRAARRHPAAPDRRREGHGGHRRRHRAADAAAGAVPGRPDRRADRLRAGAGRLPRQPLLGATRAGPRPGHRLAPARRHPHRLSPPSSRDRHRPPPPGRRPGPVPPSATPATSSPWSAPRWPRSPPPPPHRRKQRIPPGPAARAAAAALRARPGPDHRTVHTRHRDRATAARSWSTSPATPPQPREGTPSDDRTPTTPPAEHRHSTARAPTPARPAPSRRAGPALPAATRPPRRAQAAHRRRAPARRPRRRRRRGLSLTAALERLLALEVDATEARRLAGRLRFASLPTPATLEEFDYDAQPAADRALINELATCRYLESATNVLLIGPPGTGKTHLAVGLARKAAEAGYRTYFTTAADLAARCHRAAIEGRWATTMRFFAGPTLLVIDELGYLPLPAEAASALFQVVAQRYTKT